MNNKTSILLLIIGLCSLCFYLVAQEPVEADKASPPAEEKTTEVLEITVDEIRGTVEVKEADAKDWVQATKGMKLKEGAKVSTGFKSKASLLFADNSVFVVKSLTQMTITRFLQEKDTIETKIKLRIGNIRLKVKDDQPVKTDMKVTTFNTTCSVRGTEVKEIETSPDMGDIFSVASGHVLIENLEKKIRHLRGGETTDHHLIHPIEQALVQIVLNTAPFGITAEEWESAVTSVTVPMLLDVLVGDLTASSGDPSLEGHDDPTGGYDGGPGEEFGDGWIAPPWYASLYCPVCGGGAECSCAKCSVCFYPVWCCICQ